MNLFRIIRVTVSAGMALTLASCTSMVTQTQFKPFLGGSAIQGSGGTKRALNGIDIWENGEPNCKFKILGFIEDDVHENNGATPGTLNILSVASAVSLAGREKRLVATAKQHGADAIVFVAANRAFLNAGRYETNFRNQVKIAAVKYIEEGTGGIGDSQEQVESHLGAGEPISVKEMGLKLTPDEAVNFKGVVYKGENGTVIVAYNKNRADMMTLIMSDGRLTEEAIAGLLRISAQGQEWKKAVPTNAKFPLEWLRSDGLYYAVCLPEKGVFIVGNKQTLPLE